MKTRRTIKSTLALLALAGASPTLHAAQADSLCCNGTEAWTLNGMMEYAETHNLDLRSKRVAVELSEVALEADKAALFPTLSFGTNQNLSWRPWSESYTNLTDGALSMTTSTVNYNGTYGLSAQWTVWNGGINRKQVQRSKIALQQTETDEQITLLDLKEQILQLYIQILYQTEAVKVCEQILASTRALESRAGEMYEIGSMAKADYAQMQAQVSQEEYNVVNAETQLAAFKLQLKQLLEIADDRDLCVAEPSVGDDEILALLPSEADVYSAALTQRPEIRYGKLGIEAADMDIDIAKRGYYPTIGMSAGINSSASSGMGSSWGNQMKTNLNNSLGLTLNLPIFDNKRNATNVMNARLNRENAEITLAREQQSLYNTVSTLWLNARNAQQQYLSAKANVESMRQSFTLVSEQFSAGLKDIVDLTTGKNNLIQAEQQLLQSRYTALLNKTLLNFYSGTTIDI